MSETQVNAVHFTHRQSNTSRLLIKQELQVQAEMNSGSSAALQKWLATTATRSSTSNPPCKLFLQVLSYMGC